MKNKKVAALKYNQAQDRAPKVVALGQGLTAQKIIDLAREHDIPLYSDERLVNQLISLQLGDSIPPELYKVVAEILVFIYSTDQKVKELKK